MFLRKNTGIGKNLQRARALQRSHQHFENVAQNTYRNAEKLLAAAEELAGTTDCSPEEVYGMANQLRQRITAFANQVQQRRRLIELGIILIVVSTISTNISIDHSYHFFKLHTQS